MRISMMIVAAALLTAAVATPARAFDVTGTWAGKTTCKGFADGQKFATKTQIAANVSQSGPDVNVAFQGFGFLTLARAIAVPNAKKTDKGELGFVACDNRADPVLGVTGRAKVTTTPLKGKGTIKFVTIVAGKNLDGIGVADATFTCTGSLKRTATADPGVGACAMAMGAVR